MWNIRSIMNVILDDKDTKILELLKENSNFTTRQIARRIKIPITTIHNRIRRLKESGVIKKFTIDIDYTKIGKTFAAIIMVSVDYKLLRETQKGQHRLAKEINYLPEVEKVDIITGGTDFIVRVRVADVKAFDEFLLNKFQQIPGIDKTQTFVIIHES